MSTDRNGSLTQFLNAAIPKAVIAGSLPIRSIVQFSNAALPIVIKPVGRSVRLIFLQSLKADALIVVTPSGSLESVIRLQPSKALVSIVVSFEASCSLKVTVLRLLQSANA